MEHLRHLLVKALCVAVCVGYLWATEPISLRRFAKTGKIGFMDGNGIVRIPARYSGASDFNEGLAPVAILPAKKRHSRMVHMGRTASLRVSSGDSSTPPARLSFRSIFRKPGLSRRAALLFAPDGGGASLMQQVGGYLNRSSLLSGTSTKGLLRFS